jgi:hypothetical protein
MAERAPGHKEENKDNNKIKKEKPSFFPSGSTFLLP